MKLIKKLFSFLTIIAVCLSMTACNKTSLSPDGYYWFEDATSFPSAFEETLTYDVSFVHTTPSDSEQVKLDGYTIDVSKGVYTTKLKAVRTSSENYYEYSTVFEFEGVYKTPSTEKAFADNLTTYTKFKSDLSPVETKKEYSSELFNYSYKYNINYTSDKASCSLTEYIGTDNENTSTFEFKDYSNGSFIDNDTILLFTRLFNIDSSFTKPFKTIDVLSRKNFDMIYSAGILDEKVDVKSLDNYVINNVEPTEAKVTCARVSIYISDTFSGNPIEAYYATDHRTHRHRLVETYTKLSISSRFDKYDLGYLKYSLKSAKV